MANENRFGGITNVYKGGKRIAVADDCTVSPSDTEREGKAGLSGVKGYIEKPRIPFIEIKGFTDSSFRAADVDDVTDETITAELACGRTYILRDAWGTAPVEISAAEGTYTKRYEGLSCDEL